MNRTAETLCNPGALSQSDMRDRFATAPDYRAGTVAPALKYDDTVQQLWGGSLRPVMAHATTRGRFSHAALSCPATACTGVLTLAAEAQSCAYRNPSAIENILCLEGELTVQYGPSLEETVTLQRFDMVSVPAGLQHRMRNKSDKAVQAVIVLNTRTDGDYSAVFSASEVCAAGGAEPLTALDIQVDEEPGIGLEAAGLASRITRFQKLVPYKKNLSATTGIPSEATEMLSAGSVFPLIVPEGHVGRSQTAPMYGFPGLYLSIAQCTGGDDGPPPHSHSDTQETFFVLDGEWDISTGFDNESTVRANPYGVIAMPTNVMRSFRNLGSQTANLFVIIQGPEKMNDTVSFASPIGAKVERLFGKETIEAYAKIKMTFDAEERLQA